MKQYFYASGSERRGPVSFEEVRAAGLTPATLVWYEGLPDWKPAGDLPEFSDLFDAPDAPAVAPGPPPLQARPPAPAPSAATPLQPQYPQGAGPGRRRGAYDQQLAGPPPKSYLLEAILTTVLCCPPLGIVGIVNASKVESRFYAGDEEQAHYHSREAKKWVKYALIAGGVIVALYVVYFLFIIIGLGAGSI